MIYVVSDLHGEYELFCRLLDKVDFCDGDTLISCGDIIEKGRYSVKLLKFVFSLPNAICIMGNHEHMFIRHYQSLMSDSPTDFDTVLETLAGYFPDDGQLLDWETVDRLENLPYYYETEKFLCVHAGVPLDETGHILPRDRISPEQFVFVRNFYDTKLLPKDKKCVFFGHTPVTYFGNDALIRGFKRPGTKGDKIEDYYKIHLDLGSYISGVAGCFRVDDCRAFYVRTGR